MTRSLRTKGAASPCQKEIKEKSNRKIGTTPRQIGVHWTVWSVYISSYLHRDLLIDALYFRDPSDSHGISTMFLPPSPSPSLPLYPILSASTLFPSRVPVSLTSRGYFDWGQTLGFHTIYNAALSNGIEYERGWNEHMLEKWQSNTRDAERRAGCGLKRVHNGPGNRRERFEKSIYIYIIESRIRSIFRKINDLSYSMNNSFLPSPRAIECNCFVHRRKIILRGLIRTKSDPYFRARIYRSRKITEVHTFWRVSGQN